MNYLAHAYLSFKHDEVLAGNMISDFVKGKKRYDFPPGIQTGIELHRRIDAFTDLHPVTKELSKFFKPAAGAYAGAFADVAYDHFLACDKEEFPQNELENFAQYTYTVLYRHLSILPVRFANMIPYMKEQNWLLNYRNDWGIEKSFEGIVKRAAYLKDSKPAYLVFIEHKHSMQPLYREFFPQLKEYTFQQLQTLLSQTQ